MSRWNELDFDPQDYRPRSRPQPKAGFLLRLLRVCFTLGAIAAVAGAIYLGLRHSATVTDDSGVPLIKADPRPYKARPDQPGGMDVPNQDKLVFDRLDPDAARPVVERLLPPPETPLPRPVAPPAPPPSTPAPSPSPPGPVAATGIPESARVPAAATGQAPATVPPPGVASTNGETGTPVTAPSTDHDKTGKPVAVAPAGPPGAPLPGSAPGVPTSAVPKPAATAPPSPGAGGTGSYLLQLASVRSDAEAKEEVKRLEVRFHELLNGLVPSVVKADLGERGIYYRIRVGPLDEVRAHGICDHLKSQNVGCQLVRH